MVQNTLPRDEVYHFLRLGRHLERVNVMGRILHAKCRSRPEAGGVLDAAMRTGPLDRAAAKLLGLWRFSPGRARPGRAGRA